MEMPGFTLEENMLRGWGVSFDQSLSTSDRQHDARL